MNLGRFFCYPPWVQPILAITPIVASSLFFGGLLLSFIFELWFLWVAFQRGVLWFLGVLLLPVMGLVFLFVEPKSIKPFLLSFAFLAVSVFGMVTYSAAGPRNLSLKERFMRLAEELDPKLRDPVKRLEVRKTRVREWQQELGKKKAALPPNDTVAQAAFDRELQDYLVELQSVKDAMASAELK